MRDLVSLRIFAEGGGAMNATIAALISGGAGAGTVTAVHQAARQALHGAPRMDVAGMRALRRWVPGFSGLRHKKQYRLTLAGDLAANTLYYALVGAGRPRSPLLRGTWLGAVAGVGAVYLTPALGLGRKPVRRRPQTPWMAFGWYLLGGIAAGALQHVLTSARRSGDDLSAFAT